MSLLMSLKPGGQVNQLISPLIKPLINSLVGFKPADLSGLSIWLDASVNANFNSGSISDTDKVASWSDQKSGYDFVQATEDNKPTYNTSGQNNKPYVSFDGSNDFLLETAFNPWDADNNYIWLVAEYNTGGGNVLWQWGLADGTIRVGSERVTNALRLDYTNDGTGKVIGSTDYTAAAHCIRYQYTDSDTTESIYVDGSLEVTDNSDNLAVSANNYNMAIGSTVIGASPCELKVYEFIAVNGTLTDNEVINMDSYLAKKYNL